MPPKIYLFVSLLCHCAVAAVCWLGPNLPEIESEAHAKSNQASSATCPVHLMLKKEPEEKVEPLTNETAQQPKDIVGPQADEQLASADLVHTADPLASAAAASKHQKKPEATTDAAEALPPIRYMGAPQPIKAAATASASPSVPQEILPSSEAIPVADGFRRDDGLRSPAFKVTLHLDDIELVLLAHQGALLVACGQDQFLVEGTLRNPLRVVSATSDRLLAVSERTLQVRAGSCQRVYDCIRRDMPMSEERIRSCRFHLLLSNELDRLILSRQQMAAARLHCSLDELVETGGPFEFTNNRVSNYRIETVELKGGRRMKLSPGLATSGNLESLPQSK